MGSKIALKNLQDQEFSINHLDGAGAIAINSNDISKKSEIETTIAPFNKGFKNYIINGNFDHWQYKDSGLTYPQTSSGYGSDDRWNNISVGSTKTHSQIGCTDAERVLFNASKFSRTVVSSVAGAGNNCTKTQAIEDVTRLAGKTVTLSFWAKADSNKNIAIEFYQNFGTGGTPSSRETGIGSQLIALTTTWQKKTITVTLPSIIGKTLGTDGVHTSFTGLVFWFDAESSFSSRSASLGQQSGTFDIAQVQLEEGSVATPFEDIDTFLELARCQRYFEYEVGGTASKCEQAYDNRVSTQLEGAVRFKVMKRVPPSITNVTFNSGTYGATINLSKNGFMVQSTGSSTALGVYISSYSASAEL